MNLKVDVERILLAQKAVCAELVAECTHGTHWPGHLASSPLATAAAICALVVSHRPDTGETLRESLAGDGLAVDRIVQGDLCELLLESVHWLARHQNADGGWGDCDTARSNLAATLLVQTAFRMTGVPAKYADLIARADQYIVAQGGAAALRRDTRAETLVAAVLAHCALAGIIPWRQVPALPFEFVCLPKRWQSHVQPPVREYAIPALLAAGGMKFYFNPPRNPVARLLRRSLRGRSLAILQSLQAADDSFLGSTLLTAFVVTSLASTGYQEHVVVRRGVEFLLASLRGDSSWPIIGNQSVNNTTLVLNSLADAPPASRQPIATDQPAETFRTDDAQSSNDPNRAWSDTVQAVDTLIDVVPYGKAELGERGEDGTRERELAFTVECLAWLLDQQRSSADLIAGAAEGGWAASDLPTALPNTVSTAGALISLAHWRRRDAALLRERVDRAAELGVGWLLARQQDDGRWPTYRSECGVVLPEDIGTDATSQALCALAAWHRLGLPPEAAALADRIREAIELGWYYLESAQQVDGRFNPLWFGNEHQPGNHNPVVGTAQVLIAGAELNRLDTELARRASQWLIAAQHAPGGWGPPRAPRDYSPADKDGFRAWRANDSMAKLCSVEETALAVMALSPLAETDHGASQAVSRGLSWLAAAIEQDAHRRPAVIGFYPSKLWYHERLYPLAMAAGAFSRAIGQHAPQSRAIASLGRG